MNEKSPNNMKIIIKELQGNYKKDNERWIDAKEGWLNFQYTEGGKLLDKVKKKLVQQDYHRPFLYNTHFSLIKKKVGSVGVGRTEEALERFIVFANKKKLSNQYNISASGSKESIDLIELNSADEIVSLIELKPWQRTKSPAYGFVELLKNYVLLKMDDIRNLKRLILLAPRNYYVGYFNLDSVKAFLRMVNKFNEGNSVKFELRWLTLQKDVFDKMILTAEAKSHDKWVEAKKSNKKYDLMKSVDAKDVSIDRLDTLLINNWTEIRTVEDWPKEKL